MPGQQVQSDAHGTGVTPGWAVSHLHESSSAWGTSPEQQRVTAKSYSFHAGVSLAAVLGALRDPLESEKWEEGRGWDRAVGVE